MRWLQALLADEDGPTAVEYAVMLALILVVAIVAIRSVGQTTSDLWNDDQSKLSSAFTGS